MNTLYSCTEILKIMLANNLIHPVLENELGNNLNPTDLPHGNGTDS